MCNVSYNNKTHGDGCRKCSTPFGIFFFFFFLGMIILFTERTKLPNLVNICEWERRS